MASTITLAGGCFWCTESVFIRVPGVLKSVSGYANGNKDRPSYEQVCTGKTGHAEVVQVDFDPAVIGLPALLDLFFQAHDPTQLNAQGNDIGTQYRSAIYTYDEAQATAALASKAAYEPALRAQGYGPITTEIAPAGPFYFAEAYHQQYLAKNPDGYCGVGGTGVVCPIGLGVPAGSAG